MKKICCAIQLIIFCFMVGCKNNSSESKQNITNRVLLRFIQHSFVSFSHDENGAFNGYVFGNDVVTLSAFEYEKGYLMTKEDIENIRNTSVKYKVPELNGGGYWVFTYLATEFNENNGFATKPFETTTLLNDLDVHFAIYG